MHGYLKIGYISCCIVPDTSIFFFVQSVTLPYSWCPYCIYSVSGHHSLSASSSFWDRNLSSISSFLGIKHRLQQHFHAAVDGMVLKIQYLFIYLIWWSQLSLYWIFYFYFLTQRIESWDKRYQYLLFAAEPYEIIAFKVNLLWHNFLCQWVFAKWIFTLTVFSGS